MTGDLLDSLGIHPQHDAVGDKCLAGSVVRDQFIFGFRVLNRIPRCFQRGIFFTIFGTLL
jgi:hypothetical protein